MEYDEDRDQMEQINRELRRYLIGIIPRFLLDGQPACTPSLAETFCEPEPEDPEHSLGSSFRAQWNQERLREAREMCGRCSVRQGCLNHALNDPQMDGFICGGKTTAERNKIKRQMRRRKSQSTTKTA